MRVLIMPSHFGFGGVAGLGSSGAGVFFRDQAVALSRAGHDVTLLYVHFDGSEGVHIDATKSNGVRFVYVHAKPLPFGGNSIYKLALILHGYREAFRETPPDVIHAHNVLAGLHAALVSVVYRRPFILTEHSPVVAGGAVFKQRLHRVVSYARAKRLVAVSEGLAGEMRRHTRRRVDVVPNLVAQAFFDEPLQSGLTSVKPRLPYKFISVGKSVPQKGWDMLIEAFALLVEAGADARLCLCGGGGEDERLKGLCRERGVSSRVAFTGMVDHSEVRSLIRESDCHVMPSHMETFGVASIEAMALGKPVIMTSTYAADEIVRDFNGLRIPLDDVHAMVSAMWEMWSRPNRFDPVRIRADCYERFSETTVCRKLTNIYVEVVSNGTA